MDTDSLQNALVDTDFGPRFDPGWRSCTGKGVSVAIIDSGVDSTHVDLTGKIKAEFDAEKSGQKILFRESVCGDAAGHGTACAGIILKIAPDADIYSIRVLGSAGIGDGNAFLSGLEFAIKKGFQVINLSLGTTKPQFSAPLHDLLDRAYNAGCIVVSAANNLPQPSFPSVFSSSLISVTKCEEADPFKFTFSYGDVIELKAPGINIKTTWPNGSYKSLTGNSFACPHIAGIIALLLERFPSLTPFQAKAALFAIANDDREISEN